ncbi:response regulator transcription factor [Acinetobacter variabilis]|uniref:Response regulator transcription factor n=2 Tax=Acinetobacter variabilis TaxID=70346 RepID=A0A427MDL4_9GAMM|nr:MULTISPECIES: response regulator transcription factor [Acinetobacter]EXA67539.1 bacterial regulatory s, luxR family protein [Acinetobacter baumannii 348935]AUX89715.1 DNA-binding response regulator [Acinetobacter sp. ACNIH1]MCU4628479.1 response regulator transcription factor [Acinetobacter variabilis]NHB65737.1 response regulator transcription factor [Acinetobacter sp. GFQ9D191M]NHC00124.1 response regulator transcription factor [Acinetobacter sp. GFQ9D192M]
MTAQDAVLPVPVLIVEDEYVIQCRLKNILKDLGYSDEVLLFANNVREAEYLLQQEPFCLALIDLGLPDGNGISIIEKIHELGSQTLILVVSAWSTQDSLLKAIKAGATGYVLKERDDTEVSLAIRSILRGGAPIDPFIAREILKQISSSEPSSSLEQIVLDPEQESLTQREKEILSLVAQGLSNREIADELCVSRYTVESHIKHIYRKLSVSKRTKAVSTARHLGIL